MYSKISTILLAVTAVTLGTSACSHGKTDSTAVESIEKSDSLPQGVKNLVRAIADDDSVSFAKMVNYPLQRPYPLHDINNEGEMRAYYKEMVDDSLRNVVTQAMPARWSEFGWRGWSLDDGRYVWIDESTVYDMQYVSRREQQLIDSLTNEEIKSIPASIREGWKPMMCMLNEADGTIYRVDLRNEKSGAAPEHFRIAIYEMPIDLTALPTHLFEGTSETEGSEGVSIYSFTDDRGGVLILEPEAPDTGNPMLIDRNDSTIQLKRAYWHDLIHTSHAH